MRAIFILLFSSLYLSANSLESNIIEIMQRLQHDTILIQKGFFLNKFDLVKEGLQKHKKDFSELRQFNIDMLLDQSTKNYATIITAFLNNILESQKTLERHLAKGDKIRAFESYQQMNYNCIKCHALTQKWDLNKPITSK